MMLLSIPPEPSTDPPNTFLLLYSCIVVVLLTFETSALSARELARANFATDVRAEVEPEQKRRPVKTSTYFIV